MIGHGLSNTAGAPGVPALRSLARLQLSLAVMSIVCLITWGASPMASAQTPVAPPKSAPMSSVASAKPLWKELDIAQQKALQPLAPHWDGLSSGHKRKWLALSRNYKAMPAGEQALLHSRMTEWAALSPQQRTQARFNFAEVKRLPADERQAKWAEYQALSEEEKRRLAERAPARPRGAAVPARPVAAQKLVPVPAVTPKGQHTPRLERAPVAGSNPAP